MFDGVVDTPLIFKNFLIAGNPYLYSTIIDETLLKCASDLFLWKKNSNKCQSLMTKFETRAILGNISSHFIIDLR